MKNFLLSLDKIVIKKIFSAILALCIMTFSLMPVLANSKDYSTSHIINAEFKTELNVNNASKGQVVQFISTEDYNVDGVIIPCGTIFSGEVKHLKKGRFGYRRAKVVIVINEIILPNGETRSIKAFTKRHVLKGSAAANIGKGIISAPIALVVGETGVVVIIVEAVSIVGILLIGPTSYVFGETMGKLTHGINCKKHKGDEIQLKIKTIAK